MVGEALGAGVPESVSGIVALGGMPGPEEASRGYRAIAGDLTMSYDRDPELVGLYANTASARTCIAEELARFPLPLRRTLVRPRETAGLVCARALPWLFVFGRDDRILLPTDDQVLSSGFPVATIRRLTGGHAVHLDSPRATAEAIMAWEGGARG